LIKNYKKKKLLVLPTKEKQRSFGMRKRNWSQYNKQLIQRGSLIFYLHPKCLKPKKKQRESKPGRPLEFTDHVIQFLLLTKVHFKLTYRALQGFAETFLTKILPSGQVPNYTLVCKRVKRLWKALPALSGTRSKTVILDSSGLKVVGEGEWKVKMHGRGRPRKWVKVHLAVDPETQEIMSEVTTESSVGDSAVVGPLLDQLERCPKVVIADGAYDKMSVRSLLKNKRIRGLIPPPRNGKYKGENDERDKAILEICGLGGDQEARRIWGKLTGYNRRVLVETSFSRIKRQFGDRLFSKTFERQRVENRARCYLANQMRRIAA
jgi:hypothetical protein